MHIGDTFQRSREVRWAAVAVAISIVALDLSFLSFTWLQPSARVSLSWLALLSLGTLARWDAASLGLRFRPVQGWWYWTKALLVLAVVMLVLISVAYLVFYLLGEDIRMPASWHSRQILTFLLASCVDAPLYEETIYRFALCVGLVALLGRWPTIVLSGMVFAALHFIYGNPSPDNFVAGYVLAWAFLHSESLAVPIILHALGNLCVLLFMLVMT